MHLTSRKFSPAEKVPRTHALSNPYLLIWHTVGFSEASQWKLPYAEPQKLLVRSPFVKFFFFARPTKKQNRERTCYKPPANQLGCSGLREGFLQAARIPAEHLGSWKLLLPVIRAFLEASAAGGHSTDLQLVLNQHRQNAPYNHHQTAVMSKTLLPDNLSKACEFKWGRT